LTLTNPLRFAGRGGIVQNSRLPSFTALLKVIGGADPAWGYSIQFNFLSLVWFSQLSLFMGQPAIPAQGSQPAQPATYFIGYGGGDAPASLFDTGGPVNVYLRPDGTPRNANIPTKALVADFNSGKLSILFTYDGLEQFDFKFLDTGGNIIDEVTQNFNDPVKMMAVEPVGQGNLANFHFNTAAFRMSINAQDVINLLGGESPTFGVDLVSGKPVIWSIGTAENSNIEMLQETKTDTTATVDYLMNNANIQNVYKAMKRRLCLWTKS